MRIRVRCSIIVYPYCGEMRHRANLGSVCKVGFPAVNGLDLCLKLYGRDQIPDKVYSVEYSCAILCSVMRDVYRKMWRSRSSQVHECR